MIAISSESSASDEEIDELGDHEHSRLAQTRGRKEETKRFQRFFVEKRMITYDYSVINKITP